MKKAPAAVTIVVSLAIGAAGGWLAARRGSSPAPAVGPASGPPPLPTVASPGTGVVVSTEQAKADARAAVASPEAFLRSLGSVSGLQAKARIVGAVALMNLADIQQLKSALEVLQTTGSPQGWEFSSAIYERWAELDAENLLETARLSPNHSIGWTGVSAAFRKLAEADPRAAWQRARDLGPLSYAAKQAVLSAWGERDPAAAVEMASSDKMSRSDGWAVSSAFQNWLVRDPDAAKKAFASFPPGEVRTQVAANLAETLAAMDPDGALAWAATLKNPAEKNTIVGQVIGRIASEDPQRALAMANDPAYSAQRSDALRQGLAAWARRDFDAALAHAMASTSPADRQQMLSAINREATVANRAKLLALVDKLEPSAAKDVYRSALQSSYWSSDVDAKELLAGIKSPSLREELLKDSLRGWGNWEERVELFKMLQPSSRDTDQVSNLARQMGWSDPAAALKWAESLDSADLKKAATLSALQSWAGSDPQAAAAKAATLPEGDQRYEAVKSIVGQWAGSNEKEARAWAESLTGADRSAALGALVQQSAGTSPDEARALFQQFAGSLDDAGLAKAENKGVARSLAQTLTENDPKQAITWAQSLTAGGLQNEALAGIAEKWSGYDPVATSQWVGTLPPGEGRDLAAEKLVGAIARDDPESAWAWATSIADRGKRREAAGRTLDAWKAYGAKDTARAALEGAGFTPDEVKELSKRLE